MTRKRYVRPADRAIDEIREIIGGGGEVIHNVRFKGGVATSSPVRVGKPNVIVGVGDLELLLAEVEHLREVVVTAGVQLEKAFRRSLDSVSDEPVEPELRYATYACRRALSGAATVPVKR